MLVAMAVIMMPMIMVMIMTMVMGVIMAVMVMMSVLVMMVVVMSVIMRVIMIMVMAVRPVVMVMTLPMLVMMDALVRPARARVLAEYQRLDGHRHRVGRQPDLAEVDVVEIAQDHAVDGEDFALDQQFLAQDGAQGLRHVAVEHEVERLSALDRGCKPASDALRERRNAFVGRRPLPTQSQRHLALALDQIEGGEVRTDRLRQFMRLDRLATFV